MQSKWIRKTALAVALSASSIVSCERDGESRVAYVPHGAVAKEFFVGNLADPSDDPEFYWRNFVVDGSEAQSLVGIGSWSAVDRIRWEITEDLLVARQAHPRFPGADSRDPAGTDTTIVAAYAIDKHVSLIQTQDGIRTNSTDRPWHERRYMYVDWSTNLVENPSWYDMFAGKIFGDISVTPIAYYVNEPQHPNSPHFDVEQGYFDITNKFWVEPESTVLWGMKLPTCLMMGLQTGAAVDSCDKQEAVVRSSYWKVDSVPSAADFEPFENSYANLDIIGNPGGLADAYVNGFTIPKEDNEGPQWGDDNSHRRRNLHLHNIWKQSHVLVGSCTTDDECDDGACLPIAGAGGAKACTVSCNYDNRAESSSVPGTNAQCEQLTLSLVGNAGRTDSLELAAGSQCSTRNWCTLPLRNRRVKPIGYWMTEETPAELTDPFETDDPEFRNDAGEDVRLGSGPSEQTIASWNQLMRFSVAKAREVECRRTGGERQACMAQYFVTLGPLRAEQEMVRLGAWLSDKPKAMQDVLVVCHNPVRSYDDPICGKRGYRARVGDLRHNFLYYWPHATRAPWGAIANWNADPLTGMIIGASATTLSRATAQTAALLRDIILIANGELSFEDITSGTSAQLLVRRLQQGRAPRTFTASELEQRVDNVDASHAAAQVTGKKLLTGETAKHKSLELLKLRAHRVAGIGPASTFHPEFDAAAQNVRGSAFETQMLTPNWVLDAAGMKPKQTKLSDVMDIVSPLRGMDHGQTEHAQQLIDLRMQERGICYPETDAANIGNLDIQGVARFFAEKYSNQAIRNGSPELVQASDDTLAQKRSELIYTELWRESFMGMQLHGIGHSLGMLHQLASSYDSMNFLPQYWQLRSGETALTRVNSSGAGADCRGQPQQEGSACMGPRYLDPETPDELGRGNESRPGLSYFGQTSALEYPGERFSETAGLGQFDLLSMNALYGRLLQAFDRERGYSDADTAPFAYRNWSQLSEANLVVWSNPDLVKGITVESGKALPTAKLFGSGPFLQPMHYSEQARRLKLFDPERCREATKEERAQGQWRVVHGRLCAPPPRDFAFWRDFENGTPPSNEISEPLLKWRVKPTVSTAGGAIRWPYRWGRLSGAYPHINSSDSGADVYEVTRSIINQLDAQYPFTYFSRRNHDWDFFQAPKPSRATRTALGRLRALHWSMAMDTGRLGGLVGPADAPGWNSSELAEANGALFGLLSRSDDWARPQTLAASDIFEALARTLLMPQIGTYGLCDPGPAQTTRLLDADCGGAESKSLLVDASTGRHVHPDFSGDPFGAYQWDYPFKPSWTGFGVEKSDATRALLDTRSVFLSVVRESYLDSDNVNVNFRTDMPQAFDRLLGAVLSSDFETIAPYVVGGSATETSALHSTNLFGDNPTRPGGARTLFPNIGYKQQVGALVFAHIFARSSSDAALSDKLQIWLAGLSDEPGVPDAEQVRFYNPESKFTYVAKKFGPDTAMGKTVDKGIGSRMLRTANLLLARAYQVEGGSENPVLDQYGQVTVERDDNGQPILLSAVYAQEFRSYVDLLNAAVELRKAIGASSSGN